MRESSTVPGRLALYAQNLGFELAFGVATLTTAAPLLASRHVPLQDLPQHMAATSVLGRLLTGHGLDAYYELAISRTQYLIVYALAVPLSGLVGVEAALKLLAGLTLVALPYALRFVLRRTGRDERFAALAWPLVWNPQMMLGFLNFLLGVPVALVALGIFADREARRRRGVRFVLAALALTSFYAHLIPFGMLGLGALLLLDTRPLDASGESISLRTRGFLLTALNDLAFLGPAMVAAAVWLLRTPAADESVRAGGVGVVARAEWPGLASLPRELSGVLLEFPGDRDERALLLWGAAVLVAFAASRASKADTPPSAPRRAVLVTLIFVAAYLVRHRTFSWLWGSDALPEESWSQVIARALAVAAAGALIAGARPTRMPEPTWADAGARLAWLPVLCGALYALTPTSYGWIWPIHTRFAVAAALVLPLLVAGRGSDLATRAVAVLCLAASLGLSVDLSARFARWEAVELGDLDEALAHAEPHRRLLAILVPQSSAEVPNVPMLHAAAYYQALRRGDVATFSFADFPQSPFRYRENSARPPRLRPRWEWQADLDTADPEHRYYDYVLCRRGSEQPERFPEQYTRVHEGRAWILYRRR